MVSKRLRQEHNKGFFVYALGAILATIFLVGALPFLSWTSGIGTLGKSYRGDDGNYGLILYDKIVLNNHDANLYCLGVILVGVLLAKVGILLMSIGENKMYDAEYIAKTAARLAAEDEKRRKNWIDSLKP